MRQPAGTTTVEELAGLLDLMREPASHVRRVVEQVSIDGRGAGSRRVAIAIAMPAHSGTRLLDVWHPIKGTLELNSVTASCGVERLTHDEHVAVAQALIHYRFLTLVRTATAPPGVRLEDTDRVASELARLPFQSPDTALETFDRHFAYRNGRWHFNVFEDLGLSDYDQAMLDSFVRLCKRLSRRYLQLIRLRSDPGSVVEVEVTYDADYSRDEVVKIKAHQLLARARRAGKEWLNVPSPSWRFHLFWAKRTNHYLFSIDAPEDRFLSLQGLAIGEVSGPGIQHVSAGSASVAEGGHVFQADEPRWSIQTHRGRASSIFISEAHTYQQRLFALFRALELPGRSLFRMFLVTTFALAVLGLLSVWKLLKVGDLPQTAALIPTVLAVGALALQPQGNPGVLGYPARARATPAALACACVFFAFWLTARGSVAVPSSFEGGDFAHSVGATWTYWKKFGWVVVLLPLTYFWARSGWIYRKLVHAHRDRLGERTLVSNNFYR